MRKAYCINCMAEIDETMNCCPHCGYVQNVKPFPLCIKPCTILHGRYLVGRALRQEDFAITYIGYDLAMETKVAVKEYFLSSAVTRNSTIANRVRLIQLSREQWEQGCRGFADEAGRMAKLGSLAGIAGVRDVFRENQTAYMVMDYIEGETLEQRLTRNGTMSLTVCVEMLGPMINSLEKMHERGLIHKRISPDNIIIRQNESVCLLDFGADEAVLFQYDYSTRPMLRAEVRPLEQSNGKGNIGPWTDVYALCATIYQCVTGKPAPSSMDRFFDDKLSFDVPGIEPLHEAEIHILQHGLQLQPEERIQTVRELLAGLDEGKKYGKAVEKSR